MAMYVTMHDVPCDSQANCATMQQIVTQSYNSDKEKCFQAKQYDTVQHEVLEEEDTRISCELSLQAACKGCYYKNSGLASSQSCA